MTNESPVCPRCSAEALWELQDKHVHKDDKGACFSVRMLVCSMNCGWHDDHAAWFPWTGTEERFGIGSLVPDGEVPRAEDAVPMNL